MSAPLWCIAMQSLCSVMYSYGGAHPLCARTLIVCASIFSPVLVFTLPAVAVEETPPPAELLCLDILHKSTDDGAVATLTPCALGEKDGASDEQKWEFSEVIFCVIHSAADVCYLQQSRFLLSVMTMPPARVA